MKVLLVSTYELGHQPLALASPAAALIRAGHEPSCVDVAVERLEPEHVDAADAVAFSVPMHTAMRLAMRAARAVGERRPELPIAFYGLYAPVSREATEGLADAVFGGEYEGPLLDWVDGLATGGTAPTASVIDLSRGSFAEPARDLLPPLERYARLAADGEERLVGYVEASHGCVHKCRHCPIPPIYDGRIRIVDADTVLADVERLVADGARHITFGDPDFLNGRRHSLEIARDLHRRFPDVTFDCTTKVEHILEFSELWPELAALGCLFVVSALECVNDEILEILDKGHTTSDARTAIALLRAEGIEPRPSFMPFTPWTSLDDLVALLDFVAEEDLVGNVDPIQYTIRLLLPEGSLLVDHPATRPYLGGYDAERLSWRWRARDPAVDDLQARLAALVEQSVAAGASTASTFTEVRAAVREAAGLDAEPAVAIPSGSTEGRPRLTEPWFC